MHKYASILDAFKHFEHVSSRLRSYNDGIGDDDKYIDYISFTYYIYLI